MQEAFKTLVRTGMNQVDSISLVESIQRFILKLRTPRHLLVPCVSASTFQHNSKHAS